MAGGSERVGLSLAQVTGTSPETEKSVLKGAAFNSTMLAAVSNNTRKAGRNVTPSKCRVFRIEST